MKTEIKTEYPILFSTEMVKAVLDGSKTVTRRIFDVKRARIIPTKTVHSDVPLWVGESTRPAIKGNGYKIEMNPHGAVSALTRTGRKAEALGMKPSEFEWLSPYGAVGHRMWVRETFGISGNGPYFKTDVKQPETVKYAWTPAIHMPRRISRINLEVTGVKVERLQDITEDQAQAEGVVFDGHYWSGVGHYIKGFPTCHPTAKSAFQGLWNSINAKRGFGWDTNPWVWAISFKRI
jgi:hypothetical protein